MAKVSIVATPQVVHAPRTTFLIATFTYCPVLRLLHPVQDLARVTPEEAPTHREPIHHPTPMLSPTCYALMHLHHPVPSTAKPSSRNLTHMQNPVRATADEAAAEAAAVGAAAAAICPMHVVLERVVATSSGNIVACWQLVSGGEPQALRRALAAGLPNAPKADVQAVRCIS